MCVFVRSAFFRAIGDWVFLRVVCASNNFARSTVKLCKLKCMHKKKEIVHATTRSYFNIDKASD